MLNSSGENDNYKKMFDADPKNSVQQQRKPQAKGIEI